MYEEYSIVKSAIRGGYAILKTTYSVGSKGTYPASRVIVEECIPNISSAEEKLNYYQAP